MPDVYLVIGGSGFLGSTLVRMLLERDPSASVSVFDIVQRTLPANVPFYAGDLTNLSDLNSAIQKSGTTCIFHTASPVHGGQKEVYEKVNVEGTKTVIEAAKANGVKKLVFTSSAGVVFAGNDLICVDERVPYPTESFDAYNDTKARAEQIVLAANGQDGLLTCALRPAGIFGPGDRQAVPGMMNVLASGRTNFQLGDNQNLFDWTYVDNVCHAHILAADKLDAAPLDGSHFILPLRGTGTSLDARTVPTSVTRSSPPGGRDFAREVVSPGDFTSAPPAGLDVREQRRSKFDQFVHLIADLDSLDPKFAQQSGLAPPPGSKKKAEDYIPQTIGVAGEAFFVTNGQPIYFWDLARGLWAGMGHVVPSKKIWTIPKTMALVLSSLADGYGWLTGREVNFSRFRVTYTTTYRFHDIEKARRVLGYEPVVSVDEGIRRSVEWWKSEQAAKQG